MTSRDGIRARPRLPVLWYGLLGAPIAWSLQLVVGYAIVALACRAGRAVEDGPPVAAIALSAALFAVALGALGTAVANWRASRGQDGQKGPAARAAADRVRFMSFSGIFVGIVFVLGIAFATAALFVLDLCR